MSSHDGTHSRPSGAEMLAIRSESSSCYPIDSNVPDRGIPPYLRRHQASSYQRFEDAR